jgi:hypothetical protein
MEKALVKLKEEYSKRGRKRLFPKNTEKGIKVTMVRTQDKWKLFSNFGSFLE